jgi:asparagine synthetase B (glutamine-hydrolysing)
MFMLPFTKLLASSCDVVLNGLAGDAILGGNFLKYSWLQERDLNSLGRAVWRWRVSCADDELVCRLTGRVRGPSSSEARWVDSISARDGGRPVERLNDWLYDNRVFRNTNCGTMLLRGELESHAPFFDRDFVDLVLQVHPEQKLKHRLYLEVINRNFPRTSSVPWQRTNIKPARGYAANLMAMATHRLVTKAGSLIGVLTVADPSSWIRGNWRETVAGLLFDRRALDRQLVDENILRKMWSDHLNGANHSRQIGVLIAVELFARQMIDANYDHANLVEPTAYNKLV